MNSRKCHFARNYRVFSGLVASREGLQPDLQNSDEEKSWPTSCSPTEVRALVGLCSYYKWFVKTKRDLIILCRSKYILMHLTIQLAALTHGDWRSGTCGCICQWGFSAGGALLTGNCGPMYEQFECLSIMCDCLLTQLLQIIDPYLVSERCLLIMTPQDIMVTV